MKTCLDKNMHVSVDNSIIHYNEKYPRTGEWIKKYGISKPWNTILQKKKKRNTTTTWHNTNKPQKYVKLKKPKQKTTYCVIAFTRNSRKGTFIESK